MREEHDSNCKSLWDQYPKPDDSSHDHGKSLESSLQPGLHEVLALLLTQFVGHCWNSRAMMRQLYPRAVDMIMSRAYTCHKREMTIGRKDETNVWLFPIFDDEKYNQLATLSTSMNYHLNSSSGMFHFVFLSDYP